MSGDDMNKTGRRIWYAIAMFLSGLILLLSVAGIAGVWITERALANTAVQVLEAVDDLTGSLRQASQGVDEKLERMQEVTTFISTASVRLGQKVEDKGLLMLLLPEEKEQNLVELSTSVRESIGTVRNTLSAGLTIYRSIDKMPFVNLPSPSQEQVNQIEESVGAVQSAAESVETEITAFRSGASDRIGKVETGADLLTSRLGEARDRLSNLDARLEIVQETLVQLQQTVVRALVLAASLLTLLMVWVIYSQVEVIRLYVQRWKSVGAETRTEEAANQTAGTEASTQESASQTAGTEASTEAPVDQTAEAEKQEV